MWRCAHSFVYNATFMTYAWLAQVALTDRRLAERRDGWGGLFARFGGLVGRGGEIPPVR